MGPGTDPGTDPTGKRAAEGMFSQGRVKRGWLGRVERIALGRGDRQGRFEPMVIGKHERRFPNLAVGDEHAAR